MKLNKTNYQETMNIEEDTSKELLNSVILMIKRIKEETNPWLISENKKTIDLIFDEIRWRVEVYARQGDQY